MLGDKLILILIAVCTHRVMTAAQIHASIFAPHQDRDGRQTRRFLSDLFHQKLIGKTRCEVLGPHGLSCPCYFPTRDGCIAVAQATGDPRWLDTDCSTPKWTMLGHMVGLTRIRMLFNEALKLQTIAELTAWYFEYDRVTDSDDPALGYRTYTVVSTTPRKIVAVPDAVLQLTARISGKPFHKGFCIELEHGTNPVNQAAREKSPGYAGMEKLKLLKRILPEASDSFWVLCFAPSVIWRNQLQKAFKPKEGAHLWRFAAMPDVTPETLLLGKIWHPCEGEPVALLKGSK